MSVGQKSLSELGLTVTVGAAAACHAGQLHRLVEGVLLRWRERWSRSACWENRGGEEKVSDVVHVEPNTHSAWGYGGSGMHAPGCADMWRWELVFEGQFQWYYFSWKKLNPEAGPDVQLQEPRRSAHLCCVLRRFSCGALGAQPRYAINTQGEPIHRQSPSENLTVTQDYWVANATLDVNNKDEVFKEEPASLVSFHYSFPQIKVKFCTWDVTLIKSSFARSNDFSKILFGKTWMCFLGLISYFNWILKNNSLMWLLTSHPIMCACKISMSITF